MNIFLFVVFLFSDFIVVLICKSIYGKMNRYEKGFLLGIHVPEDAAQNEEVKVLREERQKTWNRFQWINLAVSCLICLICFYSFEIFILIWMAWITEYVAGIEYIVIRSRRMMYHMKMKHQWIDLKTRHLITVNGKERYVDEDEYWKKGWYSNPDDKRLLIADPVNPGNYNINFGHLAGKIMTGAFLALIVGVCVWVAYISFSFYNAETTFSLDGTKAEFAAAGYSCDFDLSEIQSVELITSLPDEHFSRTNGGSTDEYDIGHYRGAETGKCMMFVFNNGTPIIKITLKDQVIFANSKNVGEVGVWYKQLK